jgi:hypothetical protein
LAAIAIYRFLVDKAAYLHTPQSGNNGNRSAGFIFCRLMYFILAKQGHIGIVELFMDEPDQWLGSSTKGSSQDMECSKRDLIQSCICWDANGFPVRASTTADCKQAIQFIVTM